MAQGELPQEDKAGELQRQFECEFSLGRELIGVALQLLERAQRRLPRFHENNPAYYHTILALFSKSLKTFRAIHLLCCRNLGADAHALCRSLLETVATIRSFSKDGRPVEEMVIRYLDFVDYQDKKLMNALICNPELRDLISKEMRDSMDQRMKAIEQRLGQEGLKSLEGRKYWFGGFSVEQFVQDNLSKTIYDLPYRLASRALHGVDLRDHTDTTAKSASCQEQLAAQRIREALSASIVFLFILLVEFDRVFGCDMGEVISKFQTGYMEKRRR